MESTLAPAPGPDDESDEDGREHEHGGDAQHDPEDGHDAAQRLRRRRRGALVAHLGLGVHLAGGRLQGEGAEQLLLRVALEEGKGEGRVGQFIGFIGSNLLLWPSKRVGAEECSETIAGCSWGRKTKLQ